MTDQRSSYLAARPQPTALGTPQPSVDTTAIGASRGLAAWLTANKTSFALSSYQSGRLMLVGVMPDGTVSVHQQNFARAMGLWWSRNRLYLATLVQLWRLENVLSPGQLAESRFDVSLVPRNSHYTGEIDVHEIAVDADDRVILVNTLYSCLATLDETHSFRPIWRPSFISQLAPEDRCHLNGVGLENGRVKFVTAVSQTDVADGWHGRPLPKGVLIDVESDRVVTDELWMPHSPRVANGKLYALDSGRGFLVHVDRDTGEVADVAFCPGFLRGLEIVGDYALVTISKPRHGGFEGLPIDAEMKLRHATPMCGVLVIDLNTGEIVEWLKLEGEIAELFTLALMPGVKCPMSIGVTTPEFLQAITFDPEMKPFDPPEALAPASLID